MMLLGQDQSFKTIVLINYKQPEYQVQKIYGILYIVGKKVKLVS